MPFIIWLFNGNILKKHERKKHTSEKKNNKKRRLNCQLQKLDRRFKKWKLK